MMARMTGATLMRYVSELTGEAVLYVGDPPAPKTLMTCYSRSPQIDDAAEYLVEFYRCIGLPVEVQRFRDGNWPNVIAALPGATQPNKIVILSAHFHDVSEQPITWAPGAGHARGMADALLRAAGLRPGPVARHGAQGAHGVSRPRSRNGH